MEAQMSLKRSIVFAGLAAAAMAVALVVPSPASTLSPMPVLFADSLNCNLSQYKAAQGLTAAIDQDMLVVSWTGQNGAELRARYGIDGGQPVIRYLAVKKAGGQWTTLGKNLTPEYHVVSGVRRMANDQANPLRQAGIELTEDVINKNRWYAFWDGSGRDRAAAAARAMLAGAAAAARNRRLCCNRTGRWARSAPRPRFGAPTRRSTRRRAA
ncbi:MAG: hypothetical protein DMF95_05865 [Acidobacteria bacterium]|nr:MAG: hypothetical protein DMF95_05865 [Acidobacteriota bacterium]